ncbi:hypothetical protein RvY_16444-1 [Ramazzottius varieornatus]|uniref:GST N-terminal domain-containing protein n=1 Tax=Ramazzottius varieornatus TaxID=947166 RepID=A0A1D1W4V7_RAMVA|nr:hypothetical protein RvY_16444-1 [Ramazzottius varieornatus]
MRSDCLWNTSGRSWFTEKNSLGLPFPNLPYMIDGNTKWTQLRAILRHLARKHGLGAKSEEEMQKQNDRGTFAGYPEQLVHADVHVTRF